MDIIFPSWRSICWHWHNIRKAFRPCAGGGAAATSSSIVDSLGGNHSHDDPSRFAGTVNTSASRHLLPPNHPQTIRVRRIAAHLIATACECDGDKSRFGSGGRRRSLLERILWCPVNDGGVAEWRVDVVVDEKAPYAYSYDSGILTVSTGFLKYLPTDADVAAVLGHEVAHVMVRHGHEMLRNRFWVRFLVNLAAELLNVPRDRFTEDKWEFIFHRPSYFRQEYEADHLGLLLVAAAGYDPHIAPKMHEKFGRLLEMSTGRLRLLDDDDVLWSRHPEQKERIRRLLQPKVMGEALDLYEQSLRSGKGERTQALDSWSSTFTFGLSWTLFWAQECRQGVPNVFWNSVRNSFTGSRPCDHRNHVAHQVVPAPAPANWRCNNGGIAAAGSLSLQKAILFRYGTDYASGCWQVHRAHHSAYLQGNTDSPCARLLWDQLGAPRDRQEVKLFMWQLRHGRLWPARMDRLMHQLTCCKEININA